jgi:hypothetical protein
MLLAGFGYWGIGFAGAWLLAFPLGYGPVGLWWGLALGLAAVAFLLTRRLHRLAQPRGRGCRHAGTAAASADANRAVPADTSVHDRAGGL